jgi:hypothetical protein
MAIKHKYGRNSSSSGSSKCNLTVTWMVVLQVPLRNLECCCQMTSISRHLKQSKLCSQSYEKVNRKKSKMERMLQAQVVRTLWTFSRRIISRSYWWRLARYSDEGLYFRISDDNRNNKEASSGWLLSITSIRRTKLWSFPTFQRNQPSFVLRNGPRWRSRNQLSIRLTNWWSAVRAS